MTLLLSGGESALMSRVHEVRNVSPEHQGVWLAGQIDELEERFADKVVTLSNLVDSLTKELARTRERMSATATRVIVAILTASLTLLVSVIAWVVTFVVTSKP